MTEEEGLRYCWEHRNIMTDDTARFAIGKRHKNVNAIPTRTGGDLFRLLQVFVHCFMRGP